MSRKHAPLPPTDFQRLLGKIARRRDELMAEGNDVRTLWVLLDQPLWDELRPMWGNSVIKGLLGMRAELGAAPEGWRIEARVSG